MSRSSQERRYSGYDFVSWMQGRLLTHGTAQHNKDGDLVSTKQYPTFVTPPYHKRLSHASQWVIVDAKVYDLSRFANLHPGGRAVLVDSAVAGQDATEAFYGLHRHEVLERPQYARLQIGVLRGEQSVITGRLVGGLSSVPYAEPTYLSKGFHSPYYTEVRLCRILLFAHWPVGALNRISSGGCIYQNHKAFQKVVRKFFDEVVYPDAQERELDGKRPSQDVLDKMAYARHRLSAALKSYSNL